MDDNLEFGFQDIMEFVADAHAAESAAGAKPVPAGKREARRPDSMFQFDDEKHLPARIKVGGGTGTGGAPVIAQLAREMGSLPVAVVTKPFEFEGGLRKSKAEEGLAEL